MVLNAVATLQHGSGPWRLVGNLRVYYFVSHSPLMIMINSRNSVGADGEGIVSEISVSR